MHAIHRRGKETRRKIDLGKLGQHKAANHLQSTVGGTCPVLSSLTHQLCDSPTLQSVSHESTVGRTAMPVDLLVRRLVG